MSDKNWIQKATKNMRKDKPCTGEKFGSETCPPGSKRYNLAKTFRKMAKEGHKLASLEKASVLSASDDPKDQDKAREIRTRHDYESLKRQIGSKKRPTKPAVKEETLDERLGGKGYQPYTSLTGKKVSGDWEDSDRGAGNKAKKRAGGKVEKKSPTYLAHVHNKEEKEYEDEAPGTPSSVEEAKVDKGRSDYGKATIRNWRHSGPSTVEPAMFDPENKRGKTIEKRREEHKARRGVKGAKVPTYKKEEVEIDETVGAGVPLTPQELEIQKKMSKLNMRLARKRAQSMSKAKAQDTESSPEQVKEEDKAFNTVVAALRKKHGKDAVITKDSPKPKPPTEEQKKKAAAERKKRQDADNKAYAARARKAGYKSTQDYTNVVARYGSEDNYRKGKGLGT